MYSMGCTWWTSFPDDLGNTADVSPIVEAKIEILEQPGKVIEIPPPQFPCCPHCGSLLMQAPLFDFIKQSRQNESHFGEAGILNFTGRSFAQCVNPVTKSGGNTTKRVCKPK